MPRKLKTTTLAAATLTLAELVLTRDDKPPPKKEAENTYKLPTGKPLAEKLREWMDRQRKAVLGTVAKLGAGLPTHFQPLADYNDRMASAMTPLLGAYWDEAGKASRERLGLDPDEWRVTNPHTRAMIEQQAFNFSESTNATTSQQLDAALAKLRSELVAGIVEQGESLVQLTARVNAVFDRAETWRARRIAATEASRAVHAAQERAAIESGVVAGFEWLVSGDACPLCRQVAHEAKMVKVGQAFAKVGNNPQYSTIRHPPLHPSCQCSLVEVLLPEYGGPENPDWADTIDQPDPGDDYRPDPKPDPAKLAPPKAPEFLVKELPGVVLTPSQRSVDAKDQPVWVDVAALDKAWSKDAEFYVGPGQEQKPGALANVQAFVAKARERGTPIEMPRISVGDDGIPSFIDGRHRFAVLRDEGAERLPLMVTKGDAARAREKFGTAQKAKAKASE